MPNTAKAELFYTLAGQRVENVLHFTNTGTWGAVELGQLGATLLNWETNFLMPYLSQDLTFRYVQLTDLRALDGPSVPVIPAAPVNGGEASESLPNNCALCVAFSTGGRGRASRGRNYVPGIPESKSAASVAESAFATTILGAYLLLQTQLNSTAPGWLWSLVSRSFNNVPRNPPTATTITSAYLSDYVIDSQRRRSPRRGV